MGLWLLSYTERNVALIIEAESLIHARLRAAVGGLCRAALFDEGFPIDPKFASRIPTDFIGRKLSRDDTSDLFKTLSVETPKQDMSDQREVLAA
jgi:hypothetical protein